MKVLYDHQVFSWQKYGGISRYFYEIISRLSKKEKCQLELFQGFHINRYGLEAYKENCNHYFGYKRKIIPKTGRLFNLFDTIAFNLFATINKYDIYHPTYYESFLEPCKSKVVVTVYDMIHELFADEFKGDKTSLKKEKLINRADAIIAISESTKRDLINIFGVDENKIKVIYLANSIMNTPSTEKFIKNPYILYVGNRNNYKNFNILTKAFAMANLKKDFKIVCFGGHEFSQEEKNLFRQLNLQNHIEQYIGDDDLLANLYQYAEIFVYPSKYEGFGIPPLEAMHYGTPVIASSASSIPEVVGDAGLYFDPNNEEELAEKMKILIHDSTLRKSLINLGVKQEKTFSWDKCADETMKYYQEICTR